MTSPLRTVFDLARWAGSLSEAEVALDAAQQVEVATLVELRRFMEVVRVGKGCPRLDRPSTCLDRA